MSYLEIFFTFLRLGFTSFGGPVAHLSYFHREFVKKKMWLSDHGYSDLIALCQFLPGPASSQVGMAIGLSRAGIWGAFLAWLGFTLPSAIIFIFFAMGISKIENVNFQSGWIHGLKLVAAPVVGQAAYGMWKKLCIDKEQKFIAMLVAVALLQFQLSYIQLLVIPISGILGVIGLRPHQDLPHVSLKTDVSKKLGGLFLFLFVFLCVILPILHSLFPHQIVAMIDSFYRVGAMVFGGGHVVLPLLQTEVVSTGWISNDQFLAGYGLAQAIPGPLFAFSAFLGASIFKSHQILGALLLLVAIFTPSFLLIAGILPFWEQIRSSKKMRQAMMGVNAGVIGILLASLAQTVVPSAIFSIKDLILALIGFVMLEYWKISSWVVALGIVLLSIF